MLPSNTDLDIFDSSNTFILQKSRYANFPVLINCSVNVITPVSGNHCVKMSNQCKISQESGLKLRIATRSSKLALWQANYFAKLITQKIPGAIPEIVPLVTDGDRIQDRPLHEVEGKTLFIKEVENALLAGAADIAIHCFKDYHPETPPEFVIAAYLQGESDRDLLITRKPASSIFDLSKGATVGTTSQRRTFFLRRQRPDLNISMLRGNIDTRLNKLTSEKFDAIILAEAGINRLKIKLENALVLPDEIMLPAVGQGALAVEVQASNPKLIEILKLFNHLPTQVRIDAERAFVSGLSANCKSAVGVNCTFIKSGTIRLKGHLGHPETLEEISGEITGNADQASLIGKQLSKQFLERGAARLLEE